MSNDFKIVVFASGRGGNFDNLAKAQIQNKYVITKLIVDRDCLAVQKAKKHNIDCVLLDRKSSSFNQDIMSAVDDDTNLIVLAGYLSILDEAFCEKWKGKIINIHPSLLPKYGGEGMYGLNVHKAVMANKEKYSGCSVHYVDTGVDTGKVIASEKVKVDYTKDALYLSQCVYEKESTLLIKAINMIKSKHNG